MASTPGNGPVANQSDRLFVGSTTALSANDIAISPVDVAFDIKIASIGFSGSPAPAMSSSGFAEFESVAYPNGKHDTSTIFALKNTAHEG